MKSNSGRPNFITQDINEAKMTLARWRAMEILLRENLFACELHIDDMKLGVCDNSLLLPVVQSNIAEIALFLNDKPNKYE